MRKLAIVNSHGGNLDIISIVSRELRVQARMLVGKCQWTSFGHPTGLYSDHEHRFGIHGGDVETSLMLHFRPELVDMEQAADFRSTAEDLAPDAGLRPTGQTSYGWIASDLNPHGTVGNAANATAQKGKATAEHQADGFISFLREIEATDIKRFALSGRDPRRQRSAGRAGGFFLTKHQIRADQENGCGRNALRVDCPGGDFEQPKMVNDHSNQQLTNHDE